jgi:hypothetical protein
METMNQPQRHWHASTNPPSEHSWIAQFFLYFYHTQYLGSMRLMAPAAATPITGVNEAHWGVWLHGEQEEMWLQGGWGLGLRHGEEIIFRLDSLALLSWMNWELLDWRLFLGEQLCFCGI